MRSCLVVAATVGISPALCGAAGACDVAPAPCGGVVAFPVFTPEGTRVGVLEARVRAVPVLTISPVDGQPSTVVYGQPGPAAVGTVLMPLPTTRHPRRAGD